MFARSCRKRGIGSDCNEQRVSFGVNENVLKLIVVMIAYLHEYTKNQEMCTLKG